MSILRRLADLIALLVRVLGYLGLILYPAMVFVTVYEVAARYILNAPTLWAFDLIFMLHGALFMLTGAYGLQMRSHIRIDILSTQFPHRIQHATNLLFYAFLFLPAVSIMGYAMVSRAVSAYSTGEVELVSAWSPIVWPFFAALAVGLIALWLQAIVEAIHHLDGVMSGKPMPGAKPH